MFDQPLMLAFSLDAISHFADDLREERFYAFAIDAAMLCLASEETFAVTLPKYQAKFSKYFEPGNIAALRMNTGDWAYQGFADLNDSNGFDQAAYEEHYYLDEESQRMSTYGLAMDELIRSLIATGAFRHLQRSNDFDIRRVEHEY
jgi:Domain of unknown function (DUF4303)